MGKVKAQLDDMPIEYGDEYMSEEELKKDMNKKAKSISDNIWDLLDKATEIQKEVEEVEGIKKDKYLSFCCYANPLGEVDSTTPLPIGLCSKCKDKATFILEVEEI